MKKKESTYKMTNNPIFVEKIFLVDGELAHSQNEIDINREFVHLTDHLCCFSFFEITEEGKKYVSPMIHNACRYTLDEAKQIVGPAYNDFAKVFSLAEQENLDIAYGRTGVMFAIREDDLMYIEYLERVKDYIGKQLDKNTALLENVKEQEKQEKEHIRLVNKFRKKNNS